MRYQVGPGGEVPGSDLRLCPVCRSPLRSLRKFEILELSEFPGYGPDDLSQNEEIREGFRFVSGVIDYIGRKIGLRLRKRLLDRYPRSLICPTCLAVVKRE